MDNSAIFRQLTTGISFDKKKYRDDAQTFGLAKKPLKYTHGNEIRTKHIDLEDEQIKSLQKEQITSESDESNSNYDDFRLLGNEIKSSIKTSTKKQKKKSRAQIFKLHQENVNRFRNIHRIHVSGNDIPDPVDSWEKLLGEKYCLAERLLNVITAKDYGYDNPTPIQMQAIPLMLGMIQIFNNLMQESLT